MLSTHSIETIENLPPRQFVRMEAQPLVPWTPLSLMRAALQWMTAEVAPATKAVQPARDTVL